MVYYAQVRKNKNHESPRSYKLAGISIIGALISGIVLVSVIYKDSQVRPWPREYVASQKPDFSKVPGVSPEQELWATNIVADTLISLKKWAEYSKALEDGYILMSDLGNGEFVHVINFKYLRDDRNFDPQRPESLMYEVVDNKYTLLAAMYMMPELGIDDPALKNLGGALIQLHNHSDILRAPLTAAAQMANLHVWVVSNKCGVFAAADHPQLLGVASVPTESRADVCR